MSEFKEAKSAVDNVYNEMKSFIDKTIEIYLKDTNDVIKKLEDNLFELSNEDVRNAIVELSFKSYRLSDIKEKSALKAELAETLRKVMYSNTFRETEGTVANKENAATIAINNEVLVEKTYDSIANTLKTKLDEIHRVVDALKSVLVSRLSEEKLALNQTV